MRRWSEWGCVLIAALLLAGCGRSNAPKLTELPVTGKVSLEGQPVAGATVIFQSDLTLATFAAVTAPDGTYRLQSADQRAGECQGPCHVSISRFLKADGSPLGEGEVPFVVGAVESLPRATSTLETTTLTADIPAGGGNFDFDLKKP